MKDIIELLATIACCIFAIVLAIGSVCLLNYAIHQNDIKPICNEAKAAGVADKIPSCGEGK